MRRYLLKGVKISTHIADVSDEADVRRFRDEVEAVHGRGYINLLFNNAGIGGGGSFLNETREMWDRTFDICWGGVYYNTRAFMPLLLKSDEGHIINTSSINGFYAALGGGGPGVPHTAYSAAKHAVKGFTEALITDFRFNAPHLKASIVMPGNVGTDIYLNSTKIIEGSSNAEVSDETLDKMRARVGPNGIGPDNAETMSNDEIRAELEKTSDAYRENAMLSAAGAATIILDGVKQEKWRILVGKDAQNLDRTIREVPEEAYDESILPRLRENFIETFGDSG